MYKTDKQKQQENEQRIYEKQHTIATWRKRKNRNEATPNEKNSRNRLSPVMSRNKASNSISRYVGSCNSTVKDSRFPARRDYSDNQHNLNRVSLTKNNSHGCNANANPPSAVTSRNTTGNCVKRKSFNIAKTDPPTIKRQRTTNSEEENENPVTVEDMVKYGVPQSLAKKLEDRPYQMEGVRFLINKEGNALIADEMGLGKTIQSIAAMSCYIHEWGAETTAAKPLLIICPKAVTDNWRKEILMWLTDELMKGENISVIKSAKDTLFRADTKVVILTYGLACKFSSELKGFQCIICDESHNLKNSTSKRTQILLDILRDAKRVIMMTGTPAFGRPDEIYSTLYALNVTYDKKEQFLSEYAGYDDKTKMSKLHLLLKSSVMLRRTKNETGDLSLPPKACICLNVKVRDDKLMIKIRCCLSKLRQSKRKLGDHAKRVFPQFQESNKEDEEKIKSILPNLRKDSGLTKINAVSNMLKKFLTDQSKSSEKLCIFIHHQDVMDGIIKGAGLTKNDSILINGQTSSEDRENQIQRFQTNPDVRVAMLSITATGVGITLTAAANVWFAELPWAPAEITQAEDRCHRIGQTKIVNIVYVIAKDTFDEVLWSYLWEEKYKITEEIIEGQNNQTLSVEKIEFEDWLKE